ncbi:MAG: hypothetical protein V4610_01755 [Pseudomonadota bacterium]|jgi:hypothetical protein
MKFVSAICAAALALAGTTPAVATTYTPAGNFTFQGVVTYTKGVTYSCNLKLFINVPQSAPDSDGTFSHGHSATVTTVLVTPGNPLCTTITFSGTPYVVSVYGTNVNISGVVIGSLTQGFCSGTMNGTWRSTSISSFISLNASLPAGGNTPCTIVGDLYPATSPPLVITNP